MDVGYVVCRLISSELERNSVDGDSLLRKFDGPTHKHIIVDLIPPEIEVSSLNWKGYQLPRFRQRWGANL